MTVPELYERIGGSYNDAKRTLQTDDMIARFIVRFPDDRSAERLFSAAQTNDVAGMFEGAHALKGVCGNLGLTKLAAEAGALAEEFRPGNARTMDDAEVLRRVDALRADYTRATDSIRAFVAER